MGSGSSGSPSPTRTRSPSALPPLEDEDLEAEGFGYVVHDLYQERFGEAMPTFDDIPGRGEPAGEDWDEDDDTLKARFPRLWARTAES